MVNIDFFISPYITISVIYGQLFINLANIIDKLIKMKHFEQSKNEIYIGDKPKLGEWINVAPIVETLNESEEQKQIREDIEQKIELAQRGVIDRVKQMIKNYLELDNVSFLFGSGTSLHLGAVSIRNFPKEVEDYIKQTDESCLIIFKNVVRKLQTHLREYGEAHLQDDGISFKNENGWLLKIEDDLVRDNESLELVIEYEKVLNVLIAKQYVFEEEGDTLKAEKYTALIEIIKKGLFLVCDIDKRIIPTRIIDSKKNSDYEIQKNHAKLLEGTNKYIFHEKFVKSILQRPLNLKRATIFTSNYDLAFEYTFDRLGVHYIDGFAGFHKRCFKPETFEYDIFYPGSTTAGKVQRIEKVVRYIKLHGSLSWVTSDTRDANNLYGIEERPLSLIALQKKQNEVIIYPSAVKKSYTLDLPYSELFRQFSLTISQPQSVLFTIGYSFGDEHFNDIIYQALSNPSFTLIVVDYAGTKNSYIAGLRDLGDPRIIILEGDFFGDFLTFSSELMPNFDEVTTSESVANTLGKLFSKPQ